MALPSLAQGDLQLNMVADDLELLMFLSPPFMYGFYRPVTSCPVYAQD